MRIVFMGTSEFAVPVLQALHETLHTVVAVVTVPDRPAGRKLKMRSSPVKTAAMDLQYPILQPESLKDPLFQQDIQDCHADLFVVVAFRILPRSLFSIPPLGAVNIHASLLPKYRGAAPIHRALLNGETETGVTVFQIDKKVDTGAILAQNVIPIPRQMTGGELSEKLSRLGTATLIDVLKKLERQEITPVDQRDDQASAAPKIGNEDFKIDWSQPAEAIHNRIRAFSPRPGAFTSLDGKRVKLFESDYHADSDPKLPSGGFRVEGDLLRVGTGSGILEISSIQIEGKRRLTTEDFLRGYTLSENPHFD